MCNVTDMFMTTDANLFLCGHSVAKCVFNVCPILPLSLSNIYILKIQNVARGSIDSVAPGRINNQRC